MAAGGTSALTRFADNRIHQNVSESDTARLSIRAVKGTRTGVAATNRTDDDSLDVLRGRARAAKAAPKTRSSRGYRTRDARSPERAPVPRSISTLTREPRRRADRRAVSDARITAAGGVAANQTIAIANSLGVDAAMPTTTTRATVLSTGNNGGSGWASFASTDASELAATALGDVAANIAQFSEDPGDFEPGEYTVVLTPEAVSDLVGFLAYVGFSAKAFAEDRSFMSGKIGQQIMSPWVTITDDALRQRHRTELRLRGSAQAAAWTSSRTAWPTRRHRFYWAAKTDPRTPACTARAQRSRPDAAQPRDGPRVTLRSTSSSAPSSAAST